MRRWFSICLLAVGLVSVVRPVGAASPRVLKMALLAPEGSTWWRLFKRANQELERRSEGRLKVRLYAGGVAGDEPVVVRKMGLGQLHGAALTGVGLAQIEPRLLALQAPGLFKDWEQLDAAREALDSELRQLLAKKGYVLLAWGDVGFNRFFSKSMVKTPSDLGSTRPWTWTEDAVYRAFYQGAGVPPVLVGVPEVLPGLQTGLLDAFAAPPLVALSMQWGQAAQYMLDLPISVTIGAVVLRDSMVRKLTPADRELLLAVGRDVGAELARAVRRENVEALEALRRAGLRVTRPTPEAAQAWQSLAQQAADRAAERVYSKKLLADIRAAVSRR